MATASLFSTYQNQLRTNGFQHLTDIALIPFNDFRQRVRASINWRESRQLYKASQSRIEELKRYRSRVLTRANPQLSNAIRLGIHQLTSTYSYNDLFGLRSSSYVSDKAVGSMFSPAAYLTELYREGRKLHNDGSSEHIDTRRPDIKNMLLSQENMDGVISTLSLSNKILLTNIANKKDISTDQVYQELAQYKKHGLLPYHQALEAIEQTFIAKKQSLRDLVRQEEFAQKVQKATAIALSDDINPELYRLLTETITESNADQLVKDYFGDSNPNQYLSIDFLSQYFNLTFSEIAVMAEALFSSANLDLTSSSIMSLVMANNALQYLRASRTTEGRYSDFLKYIQVVPQPIGNKVQVAFNIKGKANLAVPAGVEVFVDNQSVYQENDFSTLYNQDVYISQLVDVATNITVKMVFKSQDSTSETVTAKFAIDTLSPAIALLKINKLLRVAKLFNVSLGVIEEVVRSLSSNNDLQLTDDVLEMLSYIRSYIDRFDLSEADALALAKFDISSTKPTGGVSQFDLLFNSPPLQNIYYGLDGSQLNLLPESETNYFAKSVLKRAFQVNEAELYMIMQINNRGTQGTIKNDLKNITDLYRIKLVADCFGLTVTQLNMLLSCIGEGNTSLVNLTKPAFHVLIEKLYSTTLWLIEQDMSVEQLYLMVTTAYSTQQLPEIENFIVTLVSGVTHEDSGDDELKNALSLYFAGEFNLNSSVSAFNILTWLDSIASSRSILTTQAFWAAIKDIDVTQSFTLSSDVITFIQVFAQLTLIASTWQLDDKLIEYIAKNPAMIGSSKTTAIVPNLDNLKLISRLRYWLQLSGEHAAEVLNHLSNNTLSADKLSQATGYSSVAFSQAMKYAISDDTTTLSHFSDVDKVLVWVEASQALGITPNVLMKLLNLITSDSGSQAISSYNEWESVASLIVAANDKNESKLTEIGLNEALSQALYAYYISLNPELNITTQDELYEYLLVDNQVSGEVTTSQIAEATASLQFYINRCIQGLESNVNTEQLTLTFFKQWDLYNKRYSTWAGISQLVYYPENYISPTQRINQSGLMDSFLQEISQSKLTKDNIEDGFKNYLSSFEQVANLEVIAGYHNGLENDGMCYFTARSRNSVPDFYWRQADLSMFNAGKFAASAWSDWLKIDSPVNAIDNKVRPVMFNSRLYILWIEERKENVQEDFDASKPAILNTSYILNLSYRRYDGSWSVPFTYNLSDMIGSRSDKSILELLKSGSWDFYLSDISSVDAIIITFYQPGDYKASRTTHDENGDEQVTYGLNIDKEQTLYIYPDLNIDIVNTALYFEFYRDQLNNVGQNKVSNIIYDTQQPQVTFRLDQNRPSDYLSLQNVKLTSSAVKEGTNIMLTVAPEFDVTVGGLPGEWMEMANYFEKPLSQYDQVLVTTLKWQDSLEGMDPEMQEQWAAEDISNTQHPDINVLIGLGNKGRDVVISDSTLAAENASMLFLKKDQFDWYYYRGENYFSTKFSTNDLIPWSITNKKQVFTYIMAGGSKAISAMYTDTVAYAPPGTSKLTIALNGETVETINDVQNGQVFSGKSYSVGDIPVEGKDIPLSISLGEPNGALYSGVLEVYTPKVDNTVMTIHTTESGAQYLENNPYRTRLNTLFAQELVKRANAGVDAILTMDTQKIEEPQLGRGFYATIQLPQYDIAKHGDSSAFKLYYRDVSGYGSRDLCYQGSLGSAVTVLTLFIPYPDDGFHGGISNAVIVDIEFANGLASGQNLTFKFDSTNDTATVSSINSNVFVGADVLNNQHSEYMDFNGANGLYFWELFYYTPMMAAQRLQTEQNYSEAERWLKYVFNPGGYIVEGHYENRLWNVRPLQEDNGWDAELLDSTDPDAIAQSDPMHYKLATFMNLLDLLIARGDMAYRLQERDTLTEAKMWYLNALNLLGEEPYIPVNNDAWKVPSLSEAAEQTSEQYLLRGLDLLEQHYVVFDTEELRTANSLTALFLPTENTKLKAYWQTLRQRLFNLRHNLTIDGQPLVLPLFATPADPKALLSAAVASAQGVSSSATQSVGAYRFLPMLERARSLVSQVMQYGMTLSNIIERQDSEALSILMQTQAQELMNTSISLQDRTIIQIEAEKRVLEQNLAGAQARYDSFSKLYDENINAGEQSAMDLRVMSSTLLATSQAVEAVAAGLDMVPNIYGMAVGGSRYGAIARAISFGIQAASTGSSIEADKSSQSEIYRRRRQEWGIQRDNARHEIDQVNAQIDVNTIQLEAAKMQKTYLETQQTQAIAQLTFLQSKYTNDALYSWLRGRLSGLYYQFYDIAVSRCMAAQASYSWETKDSQIYIQPGNWQDNYAGLLSGEGLMLNLATLESKYLEWNSRSLEVVRTISLADVFQQLSENAFNFTEKLPDVLENGTKVGGDTDYIEVDDKGTFNASVSLAGLKITDDYPNTAINLGEVRRIKQISATLPALLGPYQDIQALLSYVGSNGNVPEGCKMVAISNGMNDSGQFQLDFNDDRYLPFEGIDINDSGALLMQFPNAKGKQKTLLQSLNNIVLHIRYTIRK